MTKVQLLFQKLVLKNVNPLVQLSKSVHFLVGTCDSKFCWNQNILQFFYMNLVLIINLTWSSLKDL